MTKKGKRTVEDIKTNIELDKREVTYEFFIKCNDCGYLDYNETISSKDTCSECGSSNLFKGSKRRVKSSSTANTEEHNYLKERCDAYKDFINTQNKLIEEWRAKYGKK